MTPTINLVPVFPEGLNNVLNEQLVPGQSSPGDGHQVAEGEAVGQGVGLLVLWAGQVDNRSCTHAWVHRVILYISSCHIRIYLIAVA